MFAETARKIFTFRWHPGHDLSAVLVSWILVVGALYTATEIVGREVWGGMGYFLLYGVLAAGIFGVGIPVYWTVIVRRKSPAELGITTRWLWLSLALQIVFSLFQYSGTLAKGTQPAFEEFVPLLALSLTIGFFEAVFWRGWVLLRLEESFGMIPAILLGSLLYALYHIGYGMEMSEVAFLFFIGVMYAAAFRLTKNIFILWPVFQPMGQLVTLIKDGLQLPMIATLGFAEALFVMFVIVWLGSRYAQKHANS